MSAKQDLVHCPQTVLTSTALLYRRELYSPLGPSTLYPIKLLSSSYFAKKASSSSLLSQTSSSSISLKDVSYSMLQLGSSFFNSFLNSLASTSLPGITSKTKPNCPLPSSFKDWSCLVYLCFCNVLCFLNVQLHWSNLYFDI